MIRVLHIMNGADLGGISTLVLNYYRFIDRSACHFDFVLTSTDALGRNGKLLEDLGASFYWIAMKSRHPIRHASDLRKLLRSRQYDAIHVHQTLTSFFDLAIAKHTGVQLRIAHAHSADLKRRGFLERVKLRFYQALNRHYATELLACSRDAVRFAYGEKALKDPRVFVLPNAVDCRRFAFQPELRNPLRDELNIPRDAFVFGSVGRLSPEKNMEFLIRLLPELLKRRPGTFCLLIGDGVQRNALETKAKEFGISDRVIFTGQRGDVDKLLNVMDVFVVSSVHEGFCIAALEAGSNGLRLVLSDGVPEDVCFFSDCSVLSLSEPMSRWCDAILQAQGRDPEGAQIAAAHGFDIRQAANTLAQMYEQALTKN